MLVSSQIGPHVENVLAIGSTIYMAVDGRCERQDFIDLRIKAIRVPIEDYIDTTASGGSNYSVHDTEVNSDNTHPR
jgi:hypothetical protein